MRAILAFAGTALRLFRPTRPSKINNHQSTIINPVPAD
jgi:hypothetical protein